MKRILSLTLCVAMLLSMVSMAVSVGAVGEYVDQVTTENVMKITTNQTSYKAGEKVVITAEMLSIWGDRSIEGDILGYEGDILPGAYGMDTISACLIYDTSVFTAGVYTNLLPDSTIINHDANEVDMIVNNPVEARTNGAQYIAACADIYNIDYSEYGFFNGSGELWQWNLTIAKNAEPGRYYLPIGPYRIARIDEDTGTWEKGGEAVIRFADEGLNDRAWAWNANVDSMYTGDIYGSYMTYDTGYDGPSRITVGDEDILVRDDDPYQYECSYVEIVITDGEGNVPDTEPENDPSVELTLDKDSYVKGDTVTATFSIKDNAGLTDAANSEISFDNTDLKLVDVSTPIEGAGDFTVDLDTVNKLGSFDAVGKDTLVQGYFTNPVAFDDKEGTLLTATFEVLGTAEDGASKITVSNIETSYEASADVMINADGHTHSFADVIVDPTCDTIGTADKTCTCGLNFRVSTTPANGHTVSENSQVLTTPAACGKQGITITICDVCGKTGKNEVLPALEHDLKDMKTELSCTTDEATWQVCQREGCGYKTEAVLINTRLNHTVDGVEQWGEEFVYKKPTTAELGEIVKECKLCGEIRLCENIDMLEIMHGDCNMDGQINVADATHLLKYIAKWDIKYFSKENADVNIELNAMGEQMGKINVADVTLLLKHIAKWTTIEFPTYVRPMS